MVFGMQSCGRGGEGRASLSQGYRAPMAGVLRQEVGGGERWPVRGPLRKWGGG
jgi:hypothetical protein